MTPTRVLHISEINHFVMSTLSVSTSVCTDSTMMEFILFNYRGYTRKKLAGMKRASHCQSRDGVLVTSLFRPNNQTFLPNLFVIPLSDIAGLDIRTRNGLYPLLFFKCSFYVL